jgi:membrane protein DedA with SNARE-associated domain
MPETATKTITANSARNTAALFNYGNIIAMLPGLFVVPSLMLGETEKMHMIFMLIATIVPMILWFAVSIVIYIIARHHPNARTGHYTQQAAYRYYGVVGFIVVAGTFYGTNVNYWLATWVLCALILVPWSLLDVYRIFKEQWQDITVEEIEQ